MEKSVEKALDLLDSKLNSQVSLTTLKYLLSRLEVMLEKCNRLVEEMELMGNDNMKTESVRPSAHKFWMQGSV